MDNPLSCFKDMEPPKKGGPINIVDFMQLFFPFDSETEEEATNTFEGFGHYDHSLHTDDFSYMVFLQTFEEGHKGHFQIDRIEYQYISPNGKEVVGKTVPALKAELKKIDGQFVEATTFQVMYDGFVGVNGLSDLVRFATNRKIDNASSGFSPFTTKVSLNDGQMLSTGNETKITKKCCGGCND
ncbi:MAG: hypothetical protein HRT94_03895 [Alphaproteobacteria bacterium]|nr:hypothetical protein [Alphaproteobacteria bacterium]